MNEQNKVKVEGEGEGPAVSGCPSLGPKVFPSGADGTEPADGDGMKRTSILEKMNEAMFDRLGEIRDLVQKVRHDIVVGMKTHEEDNVALLGAFTRLRQLCEFYKPDDQSELQREEARRLRKIVWRCYQTKVDLAVMGKTRQNGKCYEVRVAKRQADVSDTYAQLKVNGKTVLTGNFTGSAWMAKRMMTAAAQALVNHKAKRNSDSRRNHKKRNAAKRAEAQALIDKELA